MQYVLLVLGFMVTGCTTIKEWKNKVSGEPSAEAAKAEHEDKAPPSQVAPETQPKVAVKSDDADLKFAKLWARMEELEAEQYRHKERIRLLEKGFMLGIVPEEMRQNEKYVTAPTAKPIEPQMEVVATMPHDESHEHKKEEVQAADPELYQKLLASAQGNFRAGKYGQAVVEFTEIQKKFPEAQDLASFYIGKSWIELRDYIQAKSALQNAIKYDRENRWSPFAKFELARIDLKDRRQESARKKYEEIINAYPNHEVSEMAKLQLEQMKKSL